MDNPVIASCVFSLAHVPNLVCHGSKPRRELARDPSLAARLTGALRSYDEACRYPPNQTFIGNLSPQQLGTIERPWHAARGGSDSPAGPFGEILGQDLFYALLEKANVLQPPLVELNPETARDLRAALAAHPVLGALANAGHGPSPSVKSTDPQFLALMSGEKLRGWVRRDSRTEGREDENLSAHTLLEAL